MLIVVRFIFSPIPGNENDSVERNRKSAFYRTRNYYAPLSRNVLVGFSSTHKTAQNGISSTPLNPENCQNLSKHLQTLGGNRAANFF
jgi:hypothetical protein